ncbi:ArgE/DapE family deacylase [Periweissella ghanensis]|uniref:Probable succinyl-diaminopimelate desuccinylase n=1 Tax=Periweissella ghanensis TaxID=467997 RepID=A0ABN8BN92_9LACO|nr:ArgE/DapE family deacylase [Periweissella ghanensis]MCM0600418.1 ArgE/DapE family deacylase [Periweissella ghanensis]CAH0418118.1 putative succinyl-diaminopimelate desuccinylase [Periweissella ghanensis]
MDQATQLQILQDIIKIESVNGNEAAVAEYLQRLFTQHGIESQLIPYADGRSNLVATLPGTGDKVLGFTGHMDVVAAGDESAWLYPPFSATIDGNKLYGRGSSDMKSGLAAMVIAMIELKDRNVSLPGTIKLLATVGEEVGEVGALQLTKAGFVEDLDALIIGEPSNYNLMYAHMGAINYHVDSLGKAAHSSMPAQGINAISPLAEYIIAADKAMQAITEQYINPVLPRTIHNVTVINGGEQVNTIPGSAQLLGNIRTIPEFDNEHVIKVLEDVVAKLNTQPQHQLTLTIDSSKAPVHADKDSSLIHAIQSVFNQPLPLVGLSANTDAAQFTKSQHHFDLVVFGPGVSTLPHKVNEYVEIDNYLDMITKYQAIVQAYFAQ